MTNAHIRFAPDILQRLGEELNPSPDQGILELVKNAYDADARSCRVELIDIDQPGGSIRIIDDGDGMTRAAILDGWLVIGQSGKSKQQTTRLGRTPSGSKGLGRLAALRLGNIAQIATRPRVEKHTEYRLEFDWRKFDAARVVEDVGLSIDERTRPSGSVSGSEITLRELRTTMSRMDVKRLARGLILLADPFADNPEGFKPELAAPEFSDLEKLVKKRYFDDAEFHLAAQLRKGEATASIRDWKERVLFEAAHTDLAFKRDNREYESPDATFDLWVFILSKETFETRSSTISEVQQWLGEFGGVHLYENGLRVLPYGNPGNDWLDMNLRRAQSPEERASTNTSIGRVSVTDKESLLIQKTDRTGFIESQSFAELRAFATDALEWLARRRMELAMKRRTAEKKLGRRKTREAKKALEAAVKSAPKQSRKQLQKAVTQYTGAKDREVHELKKEVQLYRTLSTAGITAATFAHESTGNPIKLMTLEIKAVERKGRKLLDAQYDTSLKIHVDRVKDSIESLAVLGTATLRLLDHGKRRLQRVDVHPVIQGILHTFEPFIKTRDVQVDSQLAPGNPHLRGSEAAVESIITNLINNSLVALELSNKANRTIRISTEINGENLIMRVADSGPGIDGIDLRDIWLPGQTTRANGTGLGLTIVKDSVSDLGGTVDAVAHGDLGGAEILIHLPIIGA